MATHVREIMNREVFSLHPMDSAPTAIGGILAMGINGAPVVDSLGVVTGMVSLRDLLDVGRDKAVIDCATTPAITIAEDATIEQAARELGERGLHRAPVVDAEGHPLGVVSALDLMRAMLGVPVAHPSAFPRLNDGLGVEMTDPANFEEATIESAPPGRGVIILIHGRYGAPELPLWAEHTADVRARLADLLTAPQDDFALSRILSHNRSHIRFRVALVADEAAGQKILEHLEPMMTPGLPVVAASSVL